MTQPKPYDFEADERLEEQRLSDPEAQQDEIGDEPRDDSADSD
jgi:hypothetical protein